MATKTDLLPTTVNPPAVAVRDAAEERILLTTTFPPPGTECLGLYLPTYYDLLVLVIER